MKRRLIVIAGEGDNVFLKAEMPYLNGGFDSVDVVGYQSSEASLATAKRLGFTYHAISETSRVCALKKMPAWWRERETKQERVQSHRYSGSSLKRAAYLAFYGLYALRLQEILDKLFEKYAEDAVILYSFWLSRGAYGIAAYRQHRNPPNLRAVVARAHGYDLYEERNSLHYLPFRSFLFQKLDRVFFISEDGKNYAKKYSGDRKRRSVLYLGTEDHGIAESAPVQRRERVIVTCSSFAPVKRLDLMDAFLRKMTDRPLEWYHIGGTAEEVEEARKSYPSLPQRRVFFYGSVDNAKIFDLYRERKPDFFLNLSDSEGIPVSMMEALSMGIPVVARNVGGVSEILRDGVGLLLEGDPLSEDNFSMAMRWIHENIDSRQKNTELRERGRRIWEAYFSAAKNYRAFVEELRRLYE